MLATLTVQERFKFFLNLVKRGRGRDLLQPRRAALFRRVWPYTMVGIRRLANAYDLARSVGKKNIPGAIVECGVWKGGCAAVMAAATEKEDPSRPLWLFDSFEGLPQPTEDDGQKAAIYSGNHADGNLETINKCVGPLEYVQEIFSALNIDSSRVHIVKGWFQDTIPTTTSDIGDIALLRLDGDWYESTKVCLDNLYDLVVPGGTIIIDDYGYWEGCRKAVDEFFAHRNISPKLHMVDETGCYWEKN